MRRKWLRFLCLFVAVYLILWELTHLAGMPTVCRTVKASLPIDTSYSYTDVPRGVKSGTDGPIYYYRATAWAPFLVCADYGWRTASQSAVGGRALYLWFLGSTFRLRELEHWSS